MIEMVAAQSENGIIGNDLEIPWRVKGEQKLFKDITMGGTLIMGRKTFDSIGRPLPGRTTIIVSRSGYEADGCRTESSIQSAIDAAKQIDAPIFVVGGGEIYRQAMPMADGIHLTTIHASVEGNVSFPDLPDDFELISETHYESNINYTYRHYRRKNRR